MCPIILSGGKHGQERVSHPPIIMFSAVHMSSDWIMQLGSAQEWASGLEVQKEVYNKTRNVCPSTLAGSRHGQKVVSHPNMMFVLLCI